jgi:hypothetical protein
LHLPEAIGPPLDVGELLEAVPGLSLSRGVEQTPYHHLDTFERTLEVVRGVERELEEARLSSSPTTPWAPGWSEGYAVGSGSPPPSPTSPRRSPRST